MDKVKFILTFVVATGIIAGGYFLSSGTIDSSLIAEKNENKNKLGIDAPLLMGKKNSNDGSAWSEGDAYVPTDARGNITRMIAQSMFLKMKQLDASGTNPFGGLNVNDPKTRALVEESIGSVPETIFETRIDEKDLNIIKDNSVSAKKRYIEGIASITKDRFPKSVVDSLRLTSSRELIDNLNKDCFEDGSSVKHREASDVYGKAFDDYKNLAVPSAWISLHKAILVHFKELSDIYGAFERCKEDPIRAYVGIDRLPKVYAETKNIQKIIDTKATELGL